MSMLIGSGQASTQSFSAATDSAATTFSDPSLCGPTLYEIVEGYSFLTIDTALLELRLMSSDMNEANQYTATLKISK